jgi:hypothetical protein
MSEALRSLDSPRFGRYPEPPFFKEVIMWWSRNNQGQGGGGFQNTDVGRSSFDRNMGPDYGVDYARFADPTDEAADLIIRRRVEDVINDNFTEEVELDAVTVRNGFVFLKGFVTSEDIKQSVSEDVRHVPGVRDVTNSLKVC